MTTNKVGDTSYTSGQLDSRIYEDVCLLGKILSHIDLSSEEEEKLKEKFLRKNNEGML